MGVLGRLYVWLYSFINHTLFKETDKLAKMKKSSKRGEYYVKSRLEKMTLEKERVKLTLAKKKLQMQLKENTVIEEVEDESDKSGRNSQANPNKLGERSPQQENQLQGDQAEIFKLEVNCLIFSPNIIFFLFIFYDSN